MHSKNNPFDYFDAIYCINLDFRTDRWTAVQKEFAKIDILDRVVRFSAIETPENGHIGCMLSHRAIIQKAQDMGWKNVLIFEDDIFFREGKKYFYYILKELENENWDLFYFGGYLSPFVNKSIMVPIRTKLARTTYIMCAHALAYNNGIYKKILNALPPSINAGKRFLLDWKCFDTWLANQQKNIIALVCRNFSVFQNRHDSDTDGNNSEWSYYKQYFYLLYKYPLLRYIMYPFVIIKNALKK